MIVKTIQKSKLLFQPSRLSVQVSSVRASVRHNFFFALIALESPPDSWGWIPGLTPGSPGARSPSGGASKGPKGPF